MNLVMLALACTGAPEPVPETRTTPSALPDAAPLPPSALDPDHARGEMVRFDQVEGFRARRLDFDGDLAILVQQDPRQESAQREAIVLAETPALVLVIDPAADIDAAMTYLEGIPGIQHVQLNPRDQAAP